MAVFIDGGFWHGHPDHFHFGTLGPYWDEKVRRTQERDRAQERALVVAGYAILRFWDFEVKASPDECARRVEEKLAELGRDRR